MARRLARAGPPNSCLPLLASQRLLVHPPALSSARCHAAGASCACPAPCAPSAHLFPSPARLPLLNRTCTVCGLPTCRRPPGSPVERQALLEDAPVPLPPTPSEAVAPAGSEPGACRTAGIGQALSLSALHPPHQHPQQGEQLRTTRIFAAGICCPMEVPLVHSVLGGLPGVHSVEVSVMAQSVVVCHDAAQASPGALVAALNGAMLEASLTVPRTQAQVGAAQWVQAGVFCFTRAS